MGQLDSQFEEIRKEYLYSLSEQIDESESLILKLDSGADVGEIVREVFRNVHSLKGGASSFEMNELTAIFHRFEEFLGKVVENKLAVDEIVDKCMGFIDIVRNCSEGILNNDQKVVEHYASYVTSVDIDIETKGNILIVDSNRAIMEMVKQVVDQNGYSYSTCQNGVKAVTRLLTEDFDGLVVGHTIEGLGGVSITSALKAMNCSNQSIPVVMIGSSENILKEFNFGIKPDHLLERNTELESKLNDIFSNLDNKEKAQDQLKVLYVEDDKILQKVFSLSMKKKSDAIVELTADKPSTFEKLQDFTPDIILLDNLLKDCTGEDILRELSSDERLKSIPVLFFTASPKDLDLDKLKEVGNVKGIIGKPFNAKTIFDDIDKAIKG